jgi:hypothetical protein
LPRPNIHHLHKLLANHSPSSSTLQLADLIYVQTWHVPKWENSLWILCIHQTPELFAGHPSATAGSKRSRFHRF